MASDSIRSHAQAEQDLLHLVLQEQVQYPWNPAEAGAEVYFAEIEQAVADEWAPGELAAQGQAIAQQLDQLWMTIEQSAASSQITALLARVSGRVPQQIIEGICQRAQQLVSSNLSMADRMVQCVQDFLSDYSSDDLLLTSRKFAVVRGRAASSNSVESALQQVRPADWSELSTGEQMYLSLAIAHAVLTEDADA